MTNTGMSITRMLRVMLLFGMVAALPVRAPALDGDWPQYGGPAADFNVQSGTLADEWPADGPPRIWERALGGGYSAIVSEGKRLYTMYRTPMVELAANPDAQDAAAGGDENAALKGDDGKAREVIIALDPDTGETIWEYAYDAFIVPTVHGPDVRYGRGPNSTPLLADGRLYTLGFTGMLHCLKADSGKVVWSHDLRKEFKAEMPYFGHAASPIRYKNALVVSAGRFMAFKLENGDLIWDNWEVEATYASPRIIRVDGRDQILAPLAGEIAGLDPADGRILWRQEHANQYKTILSSPVVMEQDLVFVSAAWVGSRGLKISWAGKESSAQEMWHNKKMQVAHSNALRVGDWIYASSGVQVDFLSAINIKTGEVAWKERGLAMANLLYADGKFILLDEDGTLALASLTPEGATLHEKVQVLDQRTWTVPTLLDTRLFIRSRGSILALELGVPSRAGVAEVPLQTSAP